MDMFSVKEISIPEGNVLKITSGNTTLWERWDYIVTPLDGSTNGLLPVISIDAKAGQKITIAYWLTKQQGYIYDGRNCGLQYYGSVSGGAYPMSDSELNKESRKTVTISTAGTFACNSFWRFAPDSHGGNSDYPTDQCYGRYMKVRIE